MKLPERLPIETHISGRKLKQSFNQLLDAVRSIIPHGDNKTIMVTTTNSGSTIQLKEKFKSGNFLGGGGTSILWAEIQTVVSTNKYTADIYSSRASYENGEYAIQEDAYVSVPDIVDELDSTDLIGVTPGTLDADGDIEYIAVQQLGAVG